MSITIKAGWIKDHEGNKIAPKTLFSQVQANDGTTLEEALKNTGTQPDWNQNDSTAPDYIKNKPFGETSSIVCEWDGTVEGRALINGPMDGWLIKIGEYVPKEKLIGSSLRVKGQFVGEYLDILFPITSDIVSDMSDNVYSANIVLDEEYDSLTLPIIVSNDACEVDGVVIPESGLYVLNLVNYSNMFDTEATFEEYYIGTKDLKQLDEKFIPDTIARKSDLEGLGGGSGSSVQPDWNQNDLTAVDYIKNKPFGLLSDIFPETTFTTGDMGEGMYGVVNPTVDFTILDGYEGTITVSFDGSDYECQGTIVEDEDMTCFGNLAMLGGEDNGMPFIIACTKDEGISIFVALHDTDATEHTIKVTCADRVLKTIDEQFLPDSVKIVYAGRRVDNERFEWNDFVYNNVGMSSIAGPGAEVFNVFSGDEVNNIAIGYYSHAEGYNSWAIGKGSHAEGSRGELKYGSVAYAEGSHAEGIGTLAKGDGCHSEGYASIADGLASHAEGVRTEATGWHSHAEGYETLAGGMNSHAEGCATVAASDSQHAQGKYNIEDTDNKYAHIVGNGSYNARSNAHTVDWLGNGWFAGTIKVGGTSYDDASEVALKSDLNNVNVDLSSYETKTDSQAKLNEAKSYADTAATNVKNDLLNGAGAAYDTLKELGDLIDDNQDAIGALETIATGKADATHKHTVADISDIDSLELITVADIDAICGTTIQNASEVTF